jgi:hypothetical protein
MGERTVDAPGVADDLDIFDPESQLGAQFLPPADGNGGRAEGTVGQGPGDAVARLREDVRKLAEDLSAIDRRDAAQHGGLKGEIAHLVRRIARLEAIPRPRPVR